MFCVPELFSLVRLELVNHPLVINSLEAEEYFLLVMLQALKQLILHGKQITI